MVLTLKVFNLFKSERHGSSQRFLSNFEKNIVIPVHLVHKAYIIYSIPKAICILSTYKIYSQLAIRPKKKTWDSYNPTDPKLSSDPISYFYFYANLCKFLLNYANLCKFLCIFFHIAKKPCRMSNKLFERNAKLKSSTLDV